MFWMIKIWSSGKLYFLSLPESKGCQTDYCDNLRQGNRQIVKANHIYNPKN